MPGKTNRKHGRNDSKCANYKRQQRREKNKLKRILKSCGFEAAYLYARKHKLVNYLKKLPVNNRKDPDSRTTVKQGDTNANANPNQTG
jgi:hypothetical protein